MALTTLANLEERLGITGTNPTDSPDAYLTNLVNRASDIVEGVLGRTVEKAQFTEYYSGENTRYLPLRQGPIIDSSTSVAVSSIVYGSGATETATSIDAQDYRVIGNESDWRLPGVLVRDHSTWDGGIRNYKVVYYAGWATVPDDIEEAALYAAVWLKNTRKDAATGGRVVADGSIDIPRGQAGLMDDLRAMLASYIPVTVL